MLSENNAAPLTPEQSNRELGYVALNNFVWLMRWQLPRIPKRNHLFCTFNDDFGKRPNPKAEAYIREFFQSWFPEKSAFEK